jgi:diacylglycerol kinase (ATP)
MRNLNRARSFLYAAKGLKQILKQEPNFRLQLVLGALALLAALLLKCTITEWVIVLGCCAFVLVSEALNTVIEEIVDWIHPEFHEKAGKIKDMAAAIPLIASLFALVTGLLIFVPKILVLVSQI